MTTEHQTFGSGTETEAERVVCRAKANFGRKRFGLVFPFFRVKEIVLGKFSL